MIKKKLANAPLFALRNFAKNIENASQISIGAALMQKGHSIDIIYEKLSRAALNYSTYDNELHLLIGFWKLNSTIFGQKSL